MTDETLVKKLLEEMKKQRLAEERIAKALEKLVQLEALKGNVYMNILHEDQEEEDD